MMEILFTLPAVRGIGVSVITPLDYMSCERHYAKLFEFKVKPP